jgi:enamine deaminase RidA (YjgF/YER057c/UK114 family)
MHCAGHRRCQIEHLPSRRAWYDPFARRDWEDNRHELFGRQDPDDIGILAHFVSQEGTLSMKTIRSPKVAEAPPQTWSNMKVANGYFHIAGMTGSGPKGEHPGDDMYIQAKSIFQKFKDLLEAAGGKMNDIMSITVYVTNLDENTEVWRARREFFTGDFPCSTLIEVERVGSPKASPPLKVEINATGVIGAGG